MRAEEYAEIRAEVGSDIPDEPEHFVAPPEPIPEPDPGLVAVLSPVVLGVGNMVCRRAGVSLLDQSEAQALAHSLALLATIYDVRPADPRAAAWMGLGLTLVAIAGARRPLVIEGEAHDVTPSG